jgi:hypothetical protein
VEDSNVDYENYRIHEASVNAGYSIYSWRNMVLSVRSGAIAGQWKEPDRYGGGDEFYWRLVNGCKVSVYSGHTGFSIFADVIFDDVPEYPDRMGFSRDRLVEIGMAFFL